MSSQPDRQILLALLLTFGAILPPLAYEGYALHDLIAARNSRVESASRDLATATETRALLQATMSLAPTFVLDRDPRTWSLFKVKSQALDASLARLKPGTLPETHAVMALRKAIESLRAGGDLMLARVRPNSSPSLVNAQLKKIAAPFAARAIQSADRLVELEEADLERLNVESRMTINSVLIALVSLAVAACTCGCVAAFLILRRFRSIRRLSRRQKRSVDIVAHDLKSPVATARMSLQLMADRISECPNREKEVDEVLQIAMRSLDSAQRLIRDLLDHSKIEAGHLVLEREWCDLNALIEDVLSRFRPEAGKKSVEIAFRADGEMARVYCDCDRIEQVLCNLVGNAIKFAPAGGHVCIVREGRNVRVEDDGPGLKAQQIGHVFESFWQADGDQPVGHGLGLSIAKDIVDAHGGQIWAESEPGQGASFAFSLPG